MMQDTDDEERRERYIRYRAAKHGCRVRSTNNVIPRPGDHCRYRLTDRGENFVILGGQFEATLDDIERYLDMAMSCGPIRNGHDHP